MLCICVHIPISINMTVSNVIYSVFNRLNKTREYHRERCPGFHITETEGNVLAL